MIKYFIGIVTTPNRRAYLKHLINSIWATADVKDDYDIRVVVDREKQGVHVMRNQLLVMASETNYDFGFLMDDDIFMLQKGWDYLYYAAAYATGYFHLSYYNTNWRNAQEPPIDVWQTQGCLHTFTPDVLREVGYYDVENFGKRGKGHGDWSARACRAGYNDLLNFKDALDSNKFIAMQIENYKPAWEIEPIEDDDRKLRISKTKGRIYIPYK